MTNKINKVDLPVVTPKSTPSRNEKYLLLTTLVSVTSIIFGFAFISNPYPFTQFLLFSQSLDEIIFTYLGVIMIALPVSLITVQFFNKNQKTLISIDEDTEAKNLSKVEVHNPNASRVLVENDFSNSETFKKYFTHIINKLELKALDSDKKASVLLDNGKLYSTIGIIYFILATICWQTYLNNVDFKPHHIYGIISSTLVFIFIEFLSAWYLRQYKSFSDTSTYLTKIKSIFDKYMLIYLVSLEMDNKNFNILLEQLSNEIKWPETYLLKNADVNFAKEALETMTTMAQAFKSEAQNKSNP